MHEWTLYLIMWSNWNTSPKFPKFGDTQTYFHINLLTLLYQILLMKLNGEISFKEQVSKLNRNR